MKKKRDYTIPLLIALFAIALFASSCKKDNKQPTVEQPVIPPISVNNTTLNIVSSQMCSGQNNLNILPNCTIEFYYDKTHLDTIPQPLFKIITDSNGKSTVIGKSARNYYYKATGNMSTGKCNQFFIKYGNISINDGWVTDFNILIQ